MVQFAIIREFPGMPFYFNLTRSVGRGYPNAAPDDVALVQFIFATLPRSQIPVPPDVQPIWLKVTVTGRTDDATLAGIDAWQAFRRKKFGVVVETDGIISAVRTATGMYGPGEAMSYDIVHLNFALLNATASIWPRIDRHSQCPASLGEAIRKSISDHLTA